MYLRLDAESSKISRCGGIDSENDANTLNVFYFFFLQTTDVTWLGVLEAVLNHSLKMIYMVNGYEPLKPLCLLLYVIHSLVPFNITH